MNNTINNNVVFQSTYVPIKTKKPVIKFTEALESSFENKGFINKTISEVRDIIHCGQVGICFDKQDLVFVGKDKVSDNFIRRQLAKVDDKVRFVDDAPEEKVEPNEIFELLPY